MIQSNYPDYEQLSQITNELGDIYRRLDTTRYFNEEAYDKEAELKEKIEKLVMGVPVEVEGKSCEEKHCGGSRNTRKTFPIYYPGKVHHIDGDSNNESFSNLAMVCPHCRAHILLSRFSPEDVWLLKTRGLSNAEIGRLLGISRERVRQLCKKYETKRSAEFSSLLETNPDDLIKKAQYIEDQLIESGRLKRRIDRRTKKKRIIAKLYTMKANGK